MKQKQNLNPSFFLVAAVTGFAAVAALIGGARAIGKWLQRHRAWLKGRPS